MPDLPKTTVRLAVKFFAGQAQRLLGERFLAAAEKEFANYGGDLTEKITGWLNEDNRAEKMLAAFKDADACFAAHIGDADLARAIHDMRLDLPSLEKLADALPATLDDAALAAAIRAQFAQDYPHLTPAQLDHAARVYADCLDRALAAKCGQLVPTLFRHVEEIRDGVNEMLPLVRDIHGQVAGARREAWQRPTPERAFPGFVGRVKELEDVCKLLAPGTRTTITAVHGTPGIGKTWLARQLAAQLDADFPGGVIVQDIGSTFRSPDLCAPILDEWGRRAGYPLARDQHLSPEQVRDWLAGHGALLVLLDDIWNAAAVQPLLRALPREASALLTTRSARLAKEMSDHVFPLDILTPADALALLRARMDKATDADTSLLQKLAEHLGRLALALHIAGTSVGRRPKSQWQSSIERIGREVRDGIGFGELPFEGEAERESRIEIALKISYDDLADSAKQRFRALGAFAPDARWSTGAAAGLWSCENDNALGQLTDLYERGLLDAYEDERWKQHPVLRDYALALLRQANEEEATRQKHAAMFAATMRQADDEQKYYVMLPDYAQLRHAFEWAIEHDLGMAQTIITATMDLQKQFGFVRDGDDWSFRLLESAQKNSDTKRLADAYIIRGNRLSDLANLPGEDRAARLRESLAAYDAALQFYRPDTAPLAYATTQNNRGTILSDLANLPGEDRAARLRESLAAYDEALRFRRPDTAPLDYAMTQNNRGNKLRDLANLPGEDRAARLRESLAGYDEALRFRRPDTAPLAYAMTQGNLGILYAELADEPGEDRRARLLSSLRCGVTALEWFEKTQHAPYIEQAENFLRYIRQKCGDLFPELWAELGGGEMPEWLQK